MEFKAFYKLREYLHQYPELSGQEVYTAAFVAQMLQKFSPMKIYSSIGGNGVVAEYCFSESGPTLLFRADMDAVAIEENLQTNYSSKCAGISHKSLSNKK